MNMGLGINQFHPARTPGLEEEVSRVATPRVDTSGVHAPGVATPGVATPGVATPEASLLPAQAAEQLAVPGDALAATDRGARRISNQHAAPAIAEAILFAPDELMLLLQALKMKTQEGQLRTAKEGLGVTGLQLEQEHKNSLGKLQESIEKGQSADAKSKISKIFSWAAKIGAVVGSLVAVGGLVLAGGITGGAAAPLLALAVMGLMSSSMSLISAIKQERGGEPLDLNIGATMACKAFLSMVGVPEAKLAAASKIMAGSLGLLTGAVLLDPQLAGSLASGAVLLAADSENWAAVTGAAVTAAVTITIAAVMLLANPGSSSEGVRKVLDAVPKLAKVAQIAVGGVSAAGSGIAASINVGVGFDEHSAALAQVDRQKFSVLIAKLQEQMEKDTEEISQTVKDIQESLSQVSRMIQQAGESRSQIAANLGPAMA